MKTLRSGPEKSLMRSSDLSERSMEGMRAYDRIPVVRYNREYILPALYEGGRTYAERLESGFDMYY